MKELIIVIGLLSLAILLTLIQPQFPRVPFETIAIGEESGVRSQEELVISDQTQWEALWQQHMSYSRNPLSLPQIDFTEEMVIAVFGGIKVSAADHQDRAGEREIGGPLFLSRPCLHQVFPSHGDDSTLPHRKAGAARAARSIPQRLTFLL